MVFTKQIFQYISEDVVFENKPLKSLAKNKEIYAYPHHGFFRPMDTYREYLELNTMWDNDKAPWRV